MKNHTTTNTKSLWWWRKRVYFDKQWLVLERGGNELHQILHPCMLYFKKWHGAYRITVKYHTKTFQIWDFPKAIHVYLNQTKLTNRLLLGIWLSKSSYKDGLLQTFVSQWVIIKKGKCKARDITADKHVLLFCLYIITMLYSICSH